ncbi:hypothetical protein MTR67_050259 [Solanum verrucosum]|uniref:Uncharacterized protein n=1 Tax=Solanum verrucosum TaxID=315347 RepID=A0AAF0V467_SOLVR|nr:hypothetical protein MTR67_050259 [Solanum verrucosum]
MDRSNIFSLFYMRRNKVMFLQSWKKIATEKIFWSPNAVNARHLAHLMPGKWKSESICSFFF